MMRGRCHVNQENLNIDWLLDGTKKLMFVSSGNGIGYIRKCPYFLMHMGLYRDEMTMSGICLKTKKGRARSCGRHNLKAFLHTDSVGIRRILPMISVWGTHLCHAQHGLC